MIVAATAIAPLSVVEMATYQASKLRNSFGPSGDSFRKESRCRTVHLLPLFAQPVRESAWGRICAHRLCAKECWGAGAGRLDGLVSGGRPAARRQPATKACA